LHSKLRKNANKSQKNLFPQKFKMGIKNAEFHADFKAIEKVLKKCTKKSY
jgi:hypothetical protein